jgi:hypothetical protein
MESTASPKTRVVFAAATGEELGAVAASPAARVADLLFETDIPVLSLLMDAAGEVLPADTLVSALPPDPVVQVMLNPRGVFKARHHSETFVIHPPSSRTIKECVGCAHVGSTAPDEWFPTRVDFYHCPKTGNVHIAFDGGYNTTVVWSVAPSLAHLVRLLRAGCALLDASVRPFPRTSPQLGVLLHNTFVFKVQMEMDPLGTDNHNPSDNYMRALHVYISLVNKRAKTTEVSKKLSGS